MQTKHPPTYNQSPLGAEITSTAAEAGIVSKDRGALNLLLYAQPVLSSDSKIHPGDQI
jgi:hypothetical protein